MLSAMSIIFLAGLPWIVDCQYSMCPEIEKYIADIFEALKDGYEPAIVPVYDESEAKVLPKLRDKYRQGK